MVELDRNALRRHLERASADGTMEEISVRANLGVTAMARNRSQMVEAPAFLSEEDGTLPEAFSILGVGDLIRFLNTGDSNVVEVDYDRRNNRLLLSNPFDFSFMTAAPSEARTTVEEAARSKVLQDIQGGQRAPLPEDVAALIKDGARIISGDDNVELEVTPSGTTFLFGAPQAGHYSEVEYPHLQHVSEKGEGYTLPLFQDALLAALDMVDDHEDAYFVVTGEDSNAAIQTEGYTHIISPR